jgi:pimeloyl-ACP methyl ester carboxylesterase
MKKLEVEFDSGSLVLRGELYLPDRQGAPGILVCHAMHAEGFRWLPLYRSFAEKASERGFACLLFDFRGCGRSEGQFDYGWGEQEDARAAFEFLLSRKEVDPNGAFVVGRSLGGTIALYALARDHRVWGFALWATTPDHHKNIRNFIVKRYGRLRYALFLLFSYLDRSHSAGKRMRIELFGLRLRLRDLRRKMMALHSAQLLSKIEHAPILLLIGDKDEYVTLQEIREFEIVGNERSRILANTGHTFKGAEGLAIEATLGEFEELLEEQRIR